MRALALALVVLVATAMPAGAQLLGTTTTNAAPPPSAPTTTAPAAPTTTAAPGRAEGGRVLPYLVVLSIGGFAVASVIVGAQYVATRPRRPPPRR